MIDFTSLFQAIDQDLQALRSDFKLSNIANYTDLNILLNMNVTTDNLVIKNYQLYHSVIASKHCNEWTYKYDLTLQQGYDQVKEVNENATNTDNATNTTSNSLYAFNSVNPTDSTKVENTALNTKQNNRSVTEKYRSQNATQKMHDYISIIDLVINDLTNFLTQSYIR